MAIAQQANEEDLNSIIKRSSIGIKPKEKTEVLTEKSIIQLSNTITSLQNSFNKIYTHTLNVKNIHQMEEKRLQNIKKEVTMETKISTASLAGGAGIEIGNLPDLFKQLTTSVEDLTKQFDKLDMAPDVCDSGTGDEDVDDDDDTRRRRRRRRGGRRGGRRAGSRRRPRPRPRPRSPGAPAGRRLGFGGRFILGLGLDMGLGMFGVGQGLDEEALTAQDEENWNRATTLEKIQSSIPRGIEHIGNLFGLTNISAQARADRIKDETEYMQRTRPANRSSERQLERAAATVTQRQAKLEKGVPPGSTSFSSRFADYINQSISNMTTWAMSASPMLAAALAGMGFVGGFFGDSGGAGSTANAEIALQYFMSQGWTRAQAAGIVGNLQGESGANLDSGAVNENDAGPGLHSYGIAQWNRERWAGLQAFAQGRGTAWHDFNTQLAYVQHELMNSERAVGNDLQGAQDAGSAAVIMSRYERYRGYQLGLASPETRRRIANANALLHGSNLAAPITGATRVGGTGVLTSGPQWRSYGYHPGADIGVPGNAPGTPIYAIDGGRVVYAGWGQSGTGFGNYGNVVAITHSSGQLSGLTTVYAHLQNINRNVRVGSDIGAGALLGGMGSTGYSTGTHLHFEVRRQWNHRPTSPAEAVNPVALYNANKWIVGGRTTTTGATINRNATEAAIASILGDFGGNRGSSLLTSLEQSPSSFFPSTRSPPAMDVSNMLNLGGIARDAWRRPQERR